MKFCSFITAICLMLFLSSCKDSPQSSENSEKIENQRGNDNSSKNEFLIAEGQVGTFKIGNTLPQTSSRYEIEKSKELRYTDSGPVSETLYFFSVNGNKHFILKSDEDSLKTEFPKIDEIWVLSDEFKTKNGIGVGTTLKEFTKIFPNYKLWYTYVSDRYVLENSVSNIQFLLDEDDYTGKKKVDQIKVPLEINDFQPGSEISKLRVYRK